MVPLHPNEPRLRSPLGGGILFRFPVCCLSLFSYFVGFWIFWNLKKEGKKRTNVNTKIHLAEHSLCEYSTVLYCAVLYSPHFVRTQPWW